MADSLSLLTELPEGFRSNFARELAASLKSKYPLNLAGIDPDALSDDVQALLATILPVTVRLSKVRPDFDATLVQLMNEVERSGVWIDSDLSSSGQMVLRAIAADIDYAQFSIARALQETFMETAQAESSILLGARMLGNRLLRNQPARVDVTLTRGDPGLYLEIAAYTAFSSNQAEYFNREIIRFPAGTISVPVVLYEGKIKKTSIVSTGTKYQSFEVGSENFKISETDVFVTIGGKSWTRTLDPLWHYNQDDTVFFESTLQTGNVEIQFGNDITGSSPPLGVAIDVMYIETSGSEANGVQSGIKFDLRTAITGLGSLVGVSTTPVSGGVDRKDATFYRLFGSNRRAAQNRAVRRGDYRAFAVEYPDVKDARFRGQAELNPNRPSWMNVIGVTLLTPTPFTDVEFQRFTDYMLERGIFQCQFLRYDPTPLEYDLVADVYCRLEANLDSVKKELTRQILDATSPTYDSLGYSWYLSDLNVLVEGGGTIKPLIEYAVIRSPTTHVICPDVLKWAKLRTLTLNMFFTRRGGYEGRLDPIASGLTGTAIT